MRKLWRPYGDVASRVCNRMHDGVWYSDARGVSERVRSVAFSRAVAPASLMRYIDKVWRDANA